VSESETWRFLARGIGPVCLRHLVIEKGHCRFGLQAVSDLVGVQYFLLRTSFSSTSHSQFSSIFWTFFAGLSLGSRSLLSDMKIPVVIGPVRKYGQRQSENND
jgi:hypothetical protein